MWTTQAGATLAAPQMVPAPPITSETSSIVSLPVKTRKWGRSRVAARTSSKYSKLRLPALIPPHQPSRARREVPPRPSPPRLVDAAVARQRGGERGDDAGQVVDLQHVCVG